MKATTLQPEDLRGVFAVPPLARRSDLSLDLEQSELIVHHIAGGGITRFLYGGNAFLYHSRRGEYEQLLEWLDGLTDDLWVVPGAGPSFGRAMDQASLLRKYQFPCVMMLPCSDPRDASGLERGYRDVAEAANTKLMVYLKDETNFGVNKEAGLDAVARLVDDGVCAAIKYALVREDPSRDGYLDALLKRVDRRFVLSGIGERPAVIHLRDWKLSGFTTGSGCIAPHLSQTLFESCARGDFKKAEELRALFLPLEDCRDELNPATVLHHGTELANIAKTGPVPPYLSALSSEQQERLTPVVRDLIELNQQSSGYIPEARSL